MKRYAVSLTYKIPITNGYSLKSHLKETEANSQEEALGKVIADSWKSNESKDLHLWAIMTLKEDQQVHIKSLEDENEHMFSLLSQVADSKEDKLWKVQNIIKEFLKSGKTQEDGSEQTGTA